jgi:hypothetical protein
MNHQLQRLQDEVASAILGMSPEQLSWHLPSKWSATEVLEHLYLTYTGTLKGLAKIFEAGRPLATRSTWTHRRRTLFVFGFGYFPSGRESPPVARPRGLPAEEVLVGIGPKIAEMEGVLRRCEEKFGRRTNLLDHPILGPLTASQWRQFHLIHGLHHVKQIRRLREAAQLPAEPERSKPK